MAGPGTGAAAVTTNAAGVAITRPFASGTTVKRGYQSGIASMVVSTVAGLGAGDELLISKNGQTVYSAAMDSQVSYQGGLYAQGMTPVYSPDSGDLLFVAAVTGTTVTLSGVTGNPHAFGDPVTSHRVLQINGAVKAEPTQQVFVALRDGTSGRVVFNQSATYMMPYVWAEWFGAKGDAVASPGKTWVRGKDATDLRPANETDSTAAIQAAIMAIPPNGGVDIRFAGNTYAISRTIELRHSAEWGNRNSMRMYGNAAQNDALDQGPTTWLWVGNATDPMLRLHTRNCRIEGIWFMAGGTDSAHNADTAALDPGNPGYAPNGYTCAAAVDIDRANQTVTCTTNSFGNCTFGNVYRTPFVQHLQTGVRIGLRNQSNCDFMRFENCSFYNLFPSGAQAEAAGVLSKGFDGSGVGVYCPNLTYQAARHMYSNCDWHGALSSPSYYGWLTTQYGIYYATGAVTIYEGHCYACKVSYLVGDSLMQNTVIGGDNENCLCLWKQTGGSNTPVTIYAHRFASGAITSPTAVGWEAISVNKQILTIDGSTFKSGAQLTAAGVDLTNQNFKIVARGTIHIRNCALPNYMPLDLSQTVEATFENVSVKTSSGGDTILNRQFLSGNLASTGGREMGTWMNSGLTIGANGGTKLLTSPAPMNWYGFALRASAGTGGSMARGWYYYTQCRVISQRVDTGPGGPPAAGAKGAGVQIQNIEVPTGTLVPVFQPNAGGSMVLLPQSAVPGDIGMTVYRATNNADGTPFAGDDGNTVPPLANFKRVDAPTGTNNGYPPTLTYNLGAVAGYYTDTAATPQGSGLPNQTTAPTAAPDGAGSPTTPCRSRWRRWRVAGVPRVSTWSRSRTSTGPRSPAGSRTRHRGRPLWASRSWASSSRSRPRRHRPRSR
jgi:hypothetical protein